MRIGKCEVCTELRAQLEIERTRYAELFAQTMGMKRDGFHQPPQYAGAEKPQVVPEEVRAAIAQISNGRGGMRLRMLREASQLLTRGEKPEAVIAQFWSTYTAAEVSE